MPRTSSDGQSIRVLMLTQYPRTPEEERLGGIMQASFRLVQALARAQVPNLKLCVITESDGVRSRESRRLTETVEVCFFPKRSSLLNAISFEYANGLRALKYGKHAFMPDLIHVQGKVNYLLAGSFVNGVPSVSTIHGIFRNEMKVVNSRPGLRGLIKKQIKIGLESLYTSRMKNLIAITDEVEAFARERSKEVRVYRINNPIDEAFFELKPLTENTDCTILFVAAITYRKGLDFLLKAMVTVLKELPHVKLRIAGIWDWDPVYVSNLKTEYSRYIEAGSIAFLGGIAQDQLLQEMENSLLLCLPSRAESAPMVIAQALAAGRPVIASDVGGIPGMVREGVTGRLWEVGSADSLATLISSLVKNRPLAMKMGIQARLDALRKYSSEGIARATVEAYQEIVSLKAGDSSAS